MRLFIVLGNLFSDQPPPIGDLDETIILPKPTGRDLFTENVSAGSFSAPKVESSSNVKVSSICGFLSYIKGLQN